MSQAEERPGTLRSLWLALRSRRTASVTLLSFASGLPLGLVWIAIPDWMRDSGVDIRVVGLFTLAQAPWSFKFVWSPLMDRFTPPWWGRRRGWASIAQVALAVLTLALAGVGDRPEAPWVVGALVLAIAFAAATQDIAIDAYAVDVLRRDEQSIAVGARTALYRAAMWVSGGAAIWGAAQLGWPAVNAILAALFLPMLVVTRWAPEPQRPATPPRTLRDAVWLPFLECLARHRALELLAFVVLYKLADNLSQSLLRPFLIDMGYNEFDRGLLLGTAGVVITIGGTFVGGVACSAIGLGHSLWIFGALQIFSNVGYLLITYAPGSRPLMYAAMSFELLTTGLGMGAFGVLLLRMTQKRFSATQYALFSSLFGLPRILAGPVTGLVVDAAGWRVFFWVTMAAGLPGLALLQRFVPLGLREPEFSVEAPRGRVPLSAAGLWTRGVVGALVGGLGSAAVAVLLIAAKAARGGGGFEPAAALARLLQPQSAVESLRFVVIAVVALAGGLGAAAVAAARHGQRPGGDGSDIDRFE